jgi:hypothetical protein
MKEISAWLRYTSATSRHGGGSPRRALGSSTSWMKPTRVRRDRLRGQLAAKRYTTSDRLLSLVTHKRTGRTAIKVTQREAWVGWSLPAGGDVVISLGFAANGRTSTTDLHVVVWPRNLIERYERDPPTQRAVRALEDQGFDYSPVGTLRHVHPPDQWAGSDDVVERIIEIFAEDVAALLATGILRNEYALRRARRGALLRGRR